jgi:hypothetical protein
MKILATLPANRLYLGQWSVLDDDSVVQLGPFPADGKSDSTNAAAHGNPTRDPKQQFGDTPTGEFKGLLGSEPDTPDNRHAYGLPDESGRIPVIWLTPIEGDTDVWKRQLSEDEAAGLPVTKHVNMGLAIHTGPPNAQNQMRPTFGCIRTWQQDFAKVVPLIKALGVGATFQVSIVAKP